MVKRKPVEVDSLKLHTIVGGGQALGELENGKKVFLWGGLPGETVRAVLTKSKSSFAEGRVVEVLQASPERIEPKDPGSYISTSPWQIMTPEAEQHYKAALIEEAFELHDIVLPEPIEVYTDNVRYGYRNKVEFSWYGSFNEKNEETLDLAFFVRGSKGKVPVDSMSLARPEIVKLALGIRDLLRTKDVQARNLKTLLIRSNQAGNTVWQLYIKDKLENLITRDEVLKIGAAGGEIIYSDPRSPASKITERLASFGEVTLQDTILNVSFRYACESFFQVNVPVYEEALRDMKQWLDNKPIVDMYSGVGTIGLTIGGEHATLVELDDRAVYEMQRNIAELKSNALAVQAPSEEALEYIIGDKTIVVDPPRAGLHEDVVKRLLEVKPARIVYLSCNPVTQARDVARLAKSYGIRAHKGYNFFPCTPHIEHLVILDLKK